jgi:hypothetical protein
MRSGTERCLCNQDSCIAGAVTKTKAGAVTWWPCWPQSSCSQCYLHALWLGWVGLQQRCKGGTAVMHVVSMSCGWRGGWECWSQGSGSHTMHYYDWELHALNAKTSLLPLLATWFKIASVAKDASNTHREVILYPAPMTCWLCPLTSIPG